MIYPCLYNAPLVYYALLLHESSNFIIEQNDHYIKQTYRNRCRILGGNGIMSLVVPVLKTHGKKTLMKDIRIDYDPPWQAIHWKSISSSYASSPFFEFISDYYQPLYLKKERYLADLNCKLLSTTLGLLNTDMTYTRSEAYEHIDFSEDIREAIHPKRKFSMASVKFHPQSYQQVFSDRHGMVDNLSILDLLFNEGQNAGQILKASISSL